MNRKTWLPEWLVSIYAFNRFARTQWIAQQAARVPAGSLVLDVGAGSSPYRDFFAHCTYETHDFAGLRPEQLWGGRGYGNLDYISDITSIPVEDETFDVVICTEVLEHVPEPILAVKELGRILRPGGRLLLTAPLGSGLHQEPYHFYGGYTPHWYKIFLNEAGFEQISIESNGGFFQHFAQESIRFVLLTAPWRGAVQLIWSPLWILFIAWGFLWIPFWAKLFDRVIDREKAFTIGYHVQAVRRL